MLGSFFRVTRAGRLGALLLGIGVACSSGATATSDDPVARFVLAADAPPAFLDVPFPSDAYRATGKIVDPVPGLDALFKDNVAYVNHELGKMNGFSRHAMSLFYVDDPGAPHDDDGNVAPAEIDPASLPKTEADCVADGSAVFFVDLAANDPSAARVACRAAVHDDRKLATSRPLVGVGPARGILLDEGHRYAAILTNRIKDTSGRKVAASADFHAIAGGDHSTALRGMYADDVATARRLIAGALATDGAEIVAIAPFTTQALTSQLYAMRDALEDSAAPALAWDAGTMAPMGATRFAAKTGGALPLGFTASLDDWLGVVPASAKLADGTDDPDADLAVRAHDKMLAVGSAVFAAQNYLQVKAGGYDTLDHATLETDAVGNPLISPDAPTTKIWATFVIPTAPMPPNGYPVVIVGHGLGSSRRYILEIANTFAAQGWAVAGIDCITFGARAPEAKNTVDATTSFAGKNGAIYAGPDGLADDENAALDFFGGLKNLGALRDQLREQGFDIAQLVKVLRSAPDLSPLATAGVAPKLDGDKIAYFGDSLGGMTGATAAAIEPHVRAWFLNVAGGGVVTEIAAHGPTVAALLGAAATFNFRFGPERLDESHPLNVIAQTIAGPGDPLEYAPMLILKPHPLKTMPTTARNIFQTEVIYDELVANEGGEALARAAGMGIALPNVGSNAGIVDIKAPANNPQRIAFKDVAPDGSGGIHDTPIPGITAVVVQVSPGQHSDDATRAHGQRSYQIPYDHQDGTAPFDHLKNTLTVRTSYRTLQASMTRFFTDAFAGNVPVVAGFTAPVRDFDDDGATDDVDADPNDPGKK